MCRGVIVTDKLGSYQVAHRAMLARVEHRGGSFYGLLPASIG